MKAPLNRHFDRRKSGYVRDYGAIDVLIFNVMGFSVGLALVTNPAFIAGLSPNAPLYGVVLVGGLLALLNGLLYAWFGGVMPSTGGDYVFVGRTIGPRLGFVANWGFTSCQIYGLALNIGWSVSVGTAPMMVAVGVRTQQVGLIEYADWLSKPTVTLLASLLLLSAYLMIAVMRLAVSRALVYGVFAVGMLGVANLLHILFATTNQEFVTNFNAFMKSYKGLDDAYALALSTAKSVGVTYKSGEEWKATFAAAPLGFLCFLGFTYSVYVGGEVSQPRRAQILGIMGAWIVGLAVFLLGMTRYQVVVGPEFHSAIGHPDVSAKLGLPTTAMNFVVACISRNLAQDLMLQVGILVWFLIIPYVILQVCAHNVVAWTCDGVLSDAFLRRRRGVSAPWVALTAVSLVAAICMVANQLVGFTLVGAVALVAVTYVLVGYSAVRLPSVRPEVFRQAAPSARTPFLGGTAFQVVGLLNVLAFSGIIWIAVSFSEVAGGTAGAAITMIAVVYISGLLVYENGLRLIRKQEFESGTRVEDLLTQIPID